MPGPAPPRSRALTTLPRQDLLDVMRLKQPLPELTSPPPPPLPLPTVQSGFRAPAAPVQRGER